MPEGRFDRPSDPAPVPRLLVELPSRRRVFFTNLGDFFFPTRLAPLELRSAPAAFWPDVFVKRGLPWWSFLESGAGHLCAFALLLAVTRFLALQPHPVPVPTFEHAQVIYYQPWEYLPPLDTRAPQPDHSIKADPEFSRQPIISVPREADNRSQTIVTAPNVKLKSDVALPNIVAWADTMEKPRLAIPEAPLTLAADISRVSPQFKESVVAPPPDAQRLDERRDQPKLQTSVVAPPPDLHGAQKGPALAAPEPVIAPPPAVASVSTRAGEWNVAHSAVIAPAPRLPLAEQQAILAGRRSARAVIPQVVPPPPSVSASGGAGGGSGSPGRFIALNLHPAVGAPADPPAGNRRGSFAATPSGHPGASGMPGSDGSGGKNAASGSGKRERGDVPGGLYVGAAAPKPSPVAGDPSSTTASNSVNPDLIASLRTPRLSGSIRPMRPAGSASLSEAERSVFGDRKFYSLTLNMPNLNSAGGSWVIRFAELKQDASAPAADLSQPTVTRKVDPAYPLQLMRQNVAGTVILYGVIHADGTVGNLRVLRSVDDRLDRFAVEAISQWKFTPATKNGSPVDVEATFHIPFRPPRDEF